MFCFRNTQEIEENPAVENKKCLDHHEASLKNKDINAPPLHIPIFQSVSRISSFNLKFYIYLIYIKLMIKCVLVSLESIDNNYYRQYTICDVFEQGTHGS